MADFRKSILFIVFLAMGKGHAQGLTLDSLIVRALRNSPDIAASRQGAIAAAQDTLLPVLFENPRLSAEVMGNITDPKKPKAGLRLSQEFRPGVRGSQSRVAKAGWKTAVAATSSREADLVEAVRSAWWSWQILHRKRSLQQAVAERWESLDRIASAKAAEGRISEVEATQARLDLANAAQRGLEIQSGIEVMEQRLRFLAQSPTGGFDSLFIDSLPPAPDPDSLAALLLSTNPDLKAADAEIVARKAQADWEITAGRSTVTLSGGFDREPDGANLVGGGIEIPLGIFNRNRTGIAKSKAAIREAELRREAALQTLLTESRRIESRLSGMARRYRAFVETIQPLGRKQLALSEKGFRQGQLGIFELSRIQQQTLAHEMEALDLLEAYRQELIRLERLSGGMK